MSLDVSIRLPLARFMLEVDARLKGALVTVMGRSGSGKTSLLEVLAGLRRGARGRVVVGGRVPQAALTSPLDVQGPSTRG